MIEIKNITSLCKAGHTQEAYQAAKAELDITPDNPWAQRAMGWALYYLIKEDAERGCHTGVLKHIDTLKTLHLLTVDNDSMIFDNILFQIASLIGKRIFATDADATDKLSAIFLRLRDYTFKPSRGYSWLLQAVIRFDSWPLMADFIEWWYLKNLTQEDYTPYVNQQGQKMMTLAERAYITYSKVLLKTMDTAKTEAFLPLLEQLTHQHEEMAYPSYFYGKLLLALGNHTDEAQRVVISFARRKPTEYWVWQLLSDVFAGDADKQLACLLRATHCRAQEAFLGKVHIKLADLYIGRQQPGCARYHIDAVARCYAAHRWNLPDEVACWMHQPWYAATAPRTDIPIDYQTITDDILCQDADESIAVVTYVNRDRHLASVVYGLKKKTTLPLRRNTAPGDIIRLRYTADKSKGIRVLCATAATLPTGLNYARYGEGTVIKRTDCEFAFLKADHISCFISPALVQAHHLRHGDRVRALMVYDYNKKRDSWGWGCAKISAP